MQRSAKMFVLVVAGSVFMLITSMTTNAQSREVNLPTPIRSDRIEATIRPRPIGDARVTTYYYTFDGSQGDVFLNAKVLNFNGDVDVFIAGSLRPLAKMVFYADSGEFETGRVIYLRKSEKLILRIEGRTPNDTDARIELRFAGSFVASTADDAPDEVRLPEPKTTDIVAERVVPSETGTPAAPSVEPKPTPTPKPSVAATTRSKPEVVVTESVPVVRPESKPSASTPTRSTQRPSAPRTPSVAAAPAETKAPPVDPMASIRLVVTFKDGTKLDRPMNEIIRFGIENSVLTIVAKNGSIGRYNMTTVASVTVQ